MGNRGEGTGTAEIAVNHGSLLALGWPRTSRVRFASLIKLVKPFDTKRDVAALMVFTLELAPAAERAQAAKLADALLVVFIDEVSEQSGKSLTAALAAILMEDTKALMMPRSAILKRKSVDTANGRSLSCTVFRPDRAWHRGKAASSKVTFRPSATGTRTAQVSISDNGGGSPQKVS